MTDNLNKFNNIKPDDKIKISGSIGMVHLKKKDKMKNVFIYYDDHSNKNYCSSNDSMFLYDLFESIRENGHKSRNLATSSSVRDSGAAEALACKASSSPCISFLFCNKRCFSCTDSNSC